MKQRRRIVSLVLIAAVAAGVSMASCSSDPSGTSTATGSSGKRATPTTSTRAPDAAQPNHPSHPCAVLPESGDPTVVSVSLSLHRSASGAVEGTATITNETTEEIVVSNVDPVEIEAINADGDRVSEHGPSLATTTPHGLQPGESITRPVALGERACGGTGPPAKYTALVLALSDKTPSALWTAPVASTG